MKRSIWRLRQTRSRAKYRCEYCLSHTALTGHEFSIDHIHPVTLGGSDDLENLCYCCPRCNTYKGDKTTGQDPATGQKVAMFNPRRQKWTDHFAWSEDGVRIIGKTSTGRATVEALKLNRKSLVTVRKFWVKHTVHPPRLR